MPGGLLFPPPPDDGLNYVIGPATSVNGNLAVFSGTSGNVLIDGGTTTVNLGYVQATRTVTSDRGADAVLTLSTAAFDGLMSAAQWTKLNGIAAGATLNLTDAALLARANHTGTQAVGTITGLGSLATLSALGGITSAGAIGSTANLPIITTTAGALTVGSFGTGANTFCQGNDGRLSDARTPTAHNQAWSTITATPTTLAGYGIADGITAAAVAASYQPLDADLTSIAALTTTTYGRSQLALADAAADTAQLNAFTTALKGLAPASGGGTTNFLRADGTWAAPPGGGGAGVTDGDKGDITVTASGATWTVDAGAITLAKQADMATASVVYRKTAGAGAPEVQTLATLKSDLGLTGTNSGDQTTITGNAGTATTLANVRTIGGSDFNGSANVTSFPVPGAIGGTTPAAGSFTTLSASTSLLVPSTAGSAAGHVYRNADTLRYRDSGNAERLLLNATDNLANLANTATARTNLGGVATLTGTETLSNKTLANIKETVFTITDAAGFAIDPANGPIQIVTLGANRTPVATNFGAGQSMLLLVDDGSGFAMTWTSVGTFANGAGAPSLTTTGYSAFELVRFVTTVNIHFVGIVS